MVLNYAAYLEERQHFEDSFRAFERAIPLFPWPHLRPLWVGYLRKFVERYGASKLERCRDLFEQAVTGCPPSEAALIYTMYADYEERHGSVRHAMAVHDRATGAVDKEHLYETYLAYIRKAEEFYGAPRTRELYERAVEALPDEQVRDMCLRFAAMETKLGEVERARAIYTHAASFCDPATHVAFWKGWQDWEVQYGTEETFRDMLRVKRSVAAQFATSHAVLLSVATAGGGGGDAAAAAAARKRQREDGGGAGADAPPGGKRTAGLGGAPGEEVDADGDGAMGGGGAGVGAGGGGGALSRFRQAQRAE
jgi:pre-mRNA-splicing factor SYF1